MKFKKKMHNIVRKYLQSHCNIQSLKQIRKIGEKSEKCESSIWIHSAIRIPPPIFSSNNLLQIMLGLIVEILWKMYKTPFSLFHAARLKTRFTGVRPEVDLSWKTPWPIPWDVYWLKSAIFKIIYRYNVCKVWVGVYGGVKGIMLWSMGRGPVVRRVCCPWAPNVLATPLVVKHVAWVETLSLTCHACVDA